MSDEAAIPEAFVSVAQFSRRFPQLCTDPPANDPLSLAEILAESSAEIEDITGRRIGPFTNLVETHPLYGVDPDEFGSNADPGMPLPFAGSLGLSFASALGASDLVRKMWLDEFAPRYPELWSYEVQSIVLRLSVGGEYVVDLANMEGPWPDSGMCRFQLGTFAPEGTTAVVTYSGGYSSIPLGITRATLYVAARSILQDMEPQSRKEVSLGDIDSRIEGLLAPWARA